VSDPPFLDPEPLSFDPEPVGMVDGESPSHPSVVHETPTGSGPCPDCKRYAQAGYIFGALVGVAAGTLVAWIILKNRLAP
jgi:hypothetical protein